MVLFASFSDGLAMPLSPEWMPVRVSAPAVLSKDQIPPKRFKKIKRHVKYDHETPFVLETNEWPILKGIIETGNRMVEEAHSMMRKAKLYIRVKRLNLPRPVMRRLLELAASRYDPKLRAIIINEDSMPTQDQNISKVYKVAAALLHEAWKADLNYVPIKDPLPLHQQIQREVDLEAEQKAEQEAMEPANFVKPKQITLFRLGSFPRLDAIEAERQRVQSLVKSIVGAQQ